MCVCVFVCMCLNICVENAVPLKYAQSVCVRGRKRSLVFELF